MTTHVALTNELSSHPHLAELASHVERRALRAYAERRTSFLRVGAAGEGLGQGGASSAEASKGAAATEGTTPEGPARDLAGKDELPAERAETPQGNLLEILQGGATTTEQQELVSTLLLMGVRKALAGSLDERIETATQLLWLAGNTPCDALSGADQILGSDASSLWTALVEVIATAEARGLSRSDAILGTVILRSSKSKGTELSIQTLRDRASDPLVLAALGLGPNDRELHGELFPAAGGRLATLVAAFSGWLLFRHTFRALGRWVLGYRRPARLELTPSGMALSWRSELLGFRLRERSRFVPLTQLLSVERELRFSRLGLFAGLGALVLGSYFGLSLFVDGLRVPGTSPILLGLGTLLILLGLALDFVLSNLSDQVQGTCRLIIQPRRGARLCVGSLTVSRADSLLHQIREQLELSTTNMTPRAPQKSQPPRESRPPREKSAPEIQPTAPTGG